MDKFEGSCYTCRHFWEDMSTNSADCRQADKMSEEEYEKYFGDECEGCPYYEIQEVWE